MTKRPIRKLRVSGGRGEARADVLFDSGSSSSAVRPDVGRRIGTARRLRFPVPISLAKEGAWIEAREVVELQVWVDERPLAGLFAVIKGLKQAVVAGADFMDD